MKKLIVLILLLISTNVFSNIVDFNNSYYSSKYHYTILNSVQPSNNQYMNPTQILTATILGGYLGFGSGMSHDEIDETLYFGLGGVYNLNEYGSLLLGSSMIKTYCKDTKQNDWWTYGLETSAVIRIKRVALQVGYNFNTQSSLIFGLGYNLQ